MIPLDLNKKNKKNCAILLLIHYKHVVFEWITFKLHGDNDIDGDDDSIKSNNIW
jgi:hypothetical protein